MGVIQLRRVEDPARAAVPGTAGSSARQRPARRPEPGRRAGSEPRTCGQVTGLQSFASAGLFRTLLVRVPPNLATSGVPYSASLPKLRVVTPAMTLPKFQTHAPRPVTPFSFCLL